MADGVEARISLLEDEREILRTLYTYARAIDEVDEERFVDCFSADGIFDVRGEGGTVIRGREELRRFMQHRARVQPSSRTHLTIEPLVTVSGDDAACTSYIAVLRDEDGDPVLGTFGRYLDRLVREADGRWRLAERVAEMEVSRGDLRGLMPSLSGR